jgi:hypothetical protein
MASACAERPLERPPVRSHARAAANPAMGPLPNEIALKPRQRSKEVQVQAFVGRWAVYLLAAAKYHRLTRLTF